MYSSLMVCREAIFQVGQLYYFMVGGCNLLGEGLYIETLNMIL